MNSLASHRAFLPAHPAAHASSRRARALAPRAQGPSGEAQRPLGDDGGAPEDAPRFQFAADAAPPPLADDWRLFRAQLVAAERAGGGGAAPAGLSALVRVSDAWAHPIARPERGCLLVARPGLDLGMFTRAVVLVTEHSPSGGAVGFCLNHPTALDVGNLGLEEALAAPLGANPLYLGGPNGRDRLNVVHGRADAGGAAEALPGVYVGGLEAALELVRGGEAAAGEVRCIGGHASWAPGQLEREADEGFWLVLAAGAGVVLGCLAATGAWRPPAGMDRATRGSWAAGARAGVREDTWRRVIECAGLDADRAVGAP